MKEDLKGKKVFVITCPELGWDCVTGVFLADSKKDLIEYLGDDYDEDMQVIHSEQIQIVKSKSEIRDEKIEQVIK